MKKIIIFTLIILGLSSCSIVQSTSFNEDDSGAISFYLEMGEFVAKMGEDALKNQMNELDFENKTNKMLENQTLIKFLDETKGVSDVQSIFDEKLYRFGVRLKFDNTTSLNNAINRLKYYQKSEKDSSAVIDDFEYYNILDKKLILNEPIMKKDNTEQTDGEKEQGDEMAKMIFMVWKINFASRKIKKIDSEFDFKKKGKKQVSLVTNLIGIGERVSETIAVIHLK